MGRLSACLAVKHCQQTLSETRPSSAQTQPSFSAPPFCHWKWKAGENKAKKALCLCATVPPQIWLRDALLWRSHQSVLLGLLYIQSQLKDRQAWHILPLFESTFLTPQPGRQPLCQTLWWQYLAGSTAQRPCLRDHYQILLGPVALESLDLWSNRLCNHQCSSYLPPNFSWLVLPIAMQF